MHGIHCRDSHVTNVRRLLVCIFCEVLSAHYNALINGMYIEDCLETSFTLAICSDTGEGIVRIFYLYLYLKENTTENNLL